MNSNVVEISVEVHCYRPWWAIHHWESKFTTSIYRLYVDQDLITERTWVWNNNTVILESLIVDVDNNIGHNVKLEPLICAPGQAQFKLSNFKLLNKQGECNSINDLEIYFILQ